MKNRISLLLLFFTSFWSYGQNIVTNGDFASGSAGWTTYQADFAGASAIFDLNDIAFVAPIAVNGTDTWHLQVFQDFSPTQISSLTVGNSYTISFQLAGPQGRPVRMFFGENGGGFAPQSIIDVEAGNAGAHSSNGFDYAVTFVLNNTYAAMKLGFELGLSADFIGIDNVSLVDNGPAGPQPPAQPAGFVALDNVGGNPVGAGQAFLACGPNNAGSGDVVYELYYSPTASAPMDPLTASEYTFGSTAGDGGGTAAFGFVIAGLDPGTEYTFWLYQYNTATMLYSTPASATVTTGGTPGGGPQAPNQPVGFVAQDNIGGNPVGSGEAFLACGPNNVGGNTIYRLYYSPTATAPVDPLTATEYNFGSTGGDGNGESAFGFVLSGLDPATEYIFWLYQYNTADMLFSTPTSATMTTPGSSGGGNPMITFSVDMSQYGGSFTQVYVSGSFNGWSGNANPMTDMGGGVWETTIEIPTGAIEYKFTLDNWTAQEQFAGGESCTVTNFGFTNRAYTVASTASIGTVCFNACTDCASAPQNYDITFQVDMSQYAGSFTTVNLNGTFNGWCGGCTPMTNMGNGIWAVTLELAAGNYEYKFTLDAWTNQEQFNPGSTCTVTNGGFTNRFLTVADNDVLPVNCFNSCNACGVVTPTYDITFQVDMSEYANPFNQVYVSGSFNGWSGNANPLTNQGNGIWSGTVTGLDPVTYEYKFTIDDWSAQEQFMGGESCTVTTGGFTNRVLTVSQTETLAVNCFNSCNACGVVTPSYDITFQVDMSQFMDPFTNVYVSGTFNGWSGNANIMTPMGNGIYMATINIQEGNHEYKFTIDDWANQEQFAGGESCTVTTGGFTNRSLSVTQMATLDLVCFNSCVACPIFNITQLNNASCGATDVTMNQLVNAQTVSGAIQYSFKITGANSQAWPNNEFVYTSNSKNFRFQFIPGAMWGETYSVEVAVMTNVSQDQFGPYGPSCSVTLQSLASQPLAVVGAADCGSTVAMDDFINTAWVPGALAYRFQIVGTNAAGWAADTYVQETTAPIRKFRFIEIPGALFGETYAVAVAYQDGSGNWTAYGASCNITIETPSTQLEVGDCGAVGVISTDFLRADNVVGAAGYRFRITGANSAGWMMDQITVDRPNRVFWMNLANGWLVGETYTIEVAVQDAAGNYGAYGPSCSVTMAVNPALEILTIDASVNTKATIEGAFGATASHNPFTRDFALNLVNANDTDAINVAIYDMSGKLIEASAVHPMDIESARFGANLATGMYMIQVTQGTNQAVIRQVKN